jgi:ABC-type methionine transport system ATPase subunit
MRCFRSEIPETTNTTVEITFTGVTADRPVISQLARTHGTDVGILGAALEIHGHQTGRTRLELPGAEAHRGRGHGRPKVAGTFCGGSRVTDPSR